MGLKHILELSWSNYRALYNCSSRGPVHFVLSYGEDRLVSNDPTFCTCPTLKCLRNMLHASLFEVTEVNPYLMEKNTGRVLIMARKREKNENDLLYEHTYPDDLLRKY